MIMANPEHGNCQVPSQNLTANVPENRLKRPQQARIRRDRLENFQPSHFQGKVDGASVSHMAVSKGTPKWMVKIMENPIKMDELEVPLFLETSIYYIGLMAPPAQNKWEHLGSCAPSKLIPMIIIWVVK